MVASPAKRNTLHELGYKIFLDRYAQKDMTRESLKVGDTVIVVVNSKTGQREVGKVTAIKLPEVTIELLDGEVVTRTLEHVDKPLETDPAQMMERVARGIAQVEATPEQRQQWTERFQWLLDDFKFVPAGRILAAAGTEQELTFYNCYVIPSPRDSREGIIETLRQMTEIMSRGGGVGINISSLRPRHGYVKGVNGRSSGAVSWGGLYSFVTGLIEQGGSRRGALMLILNDWHPDIFEFINSKREAGKITNANISVGVSDKLMAAIKADADWELMFPDTNYSDYTMKWDGDIDKWIASGRRVIKHRTVKAREVWNAIIESAWASAEPGVWFNERANKMSNSFYFNPLICTNPCVTGDSRIYTSKGLIRADELFENEEQFEVVIDGRFGYTQTTTPSTRVFMTGVKPVFRLQTKQGYYLRATAEHRIMTPSGWVEVQNLKPGDKIHILNRKGGFGEEGSLELGRVLGWMIGDGTVKSDQVVLSFFGDEKRELAPMFAEYVNDLVEPITMSVRKYPVSVLDIAERDEARVQSTRLHSLIAQLGLAENKYHVPEAVFKGTEDMQRGFLQALFTADGSFQDGGEKGGSVRLASNHLPLLEQVQQLLLNFGIASRIYANRRKAGFRNMPDSQRNPKAYWCEAQHELAISKQNMVVFASEIGFLMPYKQNALESYVGRGKRGTYAEYFTATVVSVTEDGVEEVFDLTEPLTHSFTSNGITVHNCGEQSIGAWSVCNLGAINLAKFYDAEKHDVAWDDLKAAAAYGTHFLDNVIDSTPYFFEENRERQMGERRVGLGIMGLAELLIKLGIRYGSDEGVAFTEKLFKFITEHAYVESAQIAAEKGPFTEYDERFLQSGFMQRVREELPHVYDTIKQNGMRNVTVLTVAPTGTTGTMVNTSTGIEPFFSWVYYRKSRLGLHEEQVPLVADWYAAHPDAKELPDYFAAAMDLEPEEHVRMQAAAQKWVDSSISKTANLPNEYTVEQVSKLYEYMYDLGCKGGTIYRDGSRDEQVLMLKGDERAEKEAAEKKEAVHNPAPAQVEVVTQVATPHHVYPRPSRLQGATVKTQTPFGTAYITMNSDENGQPFEVFITAPGKGGSDLQADAEGLGRMISLSLRTTHPANRRDMLRLIVEQLKDIGGSSKIGFGPSRVSSLPDAVAQALENFYLAEPEAQQMALPLPESDTPALGFANAATKKTNGKIHMDICPACSNATLIHADGCASCASCGYSRC